MTRRAILHVDMDAFFASVEQRDDPALRGKPVLVGGKGPRGVVTAASYEARPFGCRSAQPMAVALRNCPHAIVVKGSYEKYREASRIVFDILDRFTPLVQPMSIDEAYLDVTGSKQLHGLPEVIASEIRRLIRAEVNVTASVGVAPNKFLAKLASEVNKPDGLTIVPTDNVMNWLAPRSISEIPGVGKAAQKRLHELGIKTFHDLQHYPLAPLARRFGSWGETLHALARGIDHRPVHTDREAKSISHEHTFSVDVEEAEELRRVLLQECEQVGERLRRHGFHTRSITLKLRYGDFETITRSAILPEATNRTRDLWQAAEQLFAKWEAHAFRPLRLLGFGVKVHREEAPQMSLFVDAQDERATRVDGLLDHIRGKYGRDAIARGRAMRKPMQ